MPKDMRSPAAVIILPPRAPFPGSRIPGALHTLWGRSMLGHAITSAASLNPSRMIIVTGGGHGETAEAARWTASRQDVTITEAGGQHGTVRVVRDVFERLGAIPGTVLITRADMPLLSAGTLSAVARAHAADGNALTILRAAGSGPSRAAGCCAIDGGLLAAAAARIWPLIHAEIEEAAGLLIAGGHRAGDVPPADPADIITAGSRAGLEAARAAMRGRILRSLADAGADIIDPSATWADADVVVSLDAVIRPGTHLEGTTVIGAGADIGPDCTLTDTTVAEHARVRNSVAAGAVIGPGASVGPYAHLREGTVVGAGACLGTCVETKNLSVGAEVRALHHATLLDGMIGDGANIGAGTVFANYDGTAKHPVEVGAGAFAGSGTVLIAPVTVGAGAYTAAGSAIGDDVPPGALGIARGRQHNSRGWAERRRGGAEHEGRQADGRRP